MKASQLLENFGDIALDRITLNLGTGEIVLTDSDPQLPHGAVVAFRAEARVGAFKVEAKKHIGRVILTIDASSFVIDAVEMPPEPPATEPMLGPDGEVLVDPNVAAAVEHAVGDGPAPGEGMDMLNAHPFKKGSPDPAMCRECGEEEAVAVHQNPKPATVLQPEPEGGGE
jgi:hypothetical protein